MSFVGSTCSLDPAIEKPQHPRHYDVTCANSDPDTPVFGPLHETQSMVHTTAQSAIYSIPKLLRLLGGHSAQCHASAALDFTPAAPQG